MSSLLNDGGKPGTGSGKDEDGGGGGGGGGGGDGGGGAGDGDGDKDGDKGWNGRLVVDFAKRTNMVAVKNKVITF